MSGTETDEQTWPPPPERDDPMTEHTEFLTALLRTPAPKPLTRLRLYRALQQETGMERHYCWLTVRHFCERHDIFPGVRGLRLWLLFTPSLVAMTVAVATPFVMLRLIRMHDAAPTAVARRAITGEVFGLVELDGGVLVGVLLAILLVGLASLRRTRREDAEARAKMAQ